MQMALIYLPALTHWDWVTHTCVSKLTIIGSDNGLAPGRRQTIIWTNDVILLIGPLGTNFNEILIGIQTFSFEKMHLKMSSAKWRPFCLGLNVLINNRIPHRGLSSHLLLKSAQNLPNISSHHLRYMNTGPEWPCILVAVGRNCS